MLSFVVQQTIFYVCADDHGNYCFDKYFRISDRGMIKGGTQDWWLLPLIPRALS